ncbi:MAG: hypothetical protein AB7N54_19475 [Alphaproteobacteria bacterium]
MAHVERNIVLHAGDDVEITVDVFDADNQPLGLEGASVTWAVAERDAGAERVITKISPGGISFGEEPNRFVIAIAGEDTAGLSGRYRHQAQVTDGAGNRSTVLSGILNVLPTILGESE